MEEMTKRDFLHEGNLFLCNHSFPLSKFRPLLSNRLIFRSVNQNIGGIIRGWALIKNFAPYNPATVNKHAGLQSPAEQLNGKRYHDCWLQNLLISASLGGFRGFP
ncbi:MAG: hypothetical protein D3904_14490 [Candidatus Electrothrix sp. EH2]|nr:hypothetical protein [Candidatus Electrothrix sp. EH2]